MASENNKLCLGNFLLEDLYLGANRIIKMCLGETIIYEGDASSNPVPDIPELPKININDYVTFEALEDGLTVSLSRNTCEYCIDGVDEWTALSAGTATPSINSGQTLSIRATITPASNYGVGTFTIEKKCNVIGNAMSLLFGDEGKNNLSLSGKNYAFQKLFQNATNLVAVSEGFFPATTLSTYCYDYTFDGCSSLTTAPDLPATTLQQYCYRYMFRGCSSLTTAPALPATSLTNYCYQYMFYNCSKLNYIKAMFTTDPGNRNSSNQARYTYNWVSGVASSGTFVKNSNASWSRTGDHAVPSGWTTQTVSS